MRFFDYDHDGRATEFMLLAGSIMCTTPKDAIVVGLDPRNRKLHAFTDGQSLDPLYLRPGNWERVRSHVPVTVVEWECGNHAAEEERDVRVTADSIGLHASRVTRSCGRRSNGTLLAPPE